MVYATAGDARFRDGKKAVEDATKACELSGWKNGGILDTLAAAAYAEAGDVDSAIRWQTKAIEIIEPRHKADCQSRLDLYKAHKPYRGK